MNPYQNTKDIKLIFESEYSDKQKLFGFNDTFQNFKVFKCKIPLILPVEFKNEYINWFDNLKQSDIIILIEKYDENKYEIITSNKNIGFQKFLIAGIVNYIDNNNNTIFEQITNETETVYYNTRMYKINEDFIKNDILSPEEGKELEDYKITNFIKKIKYNSPKSKFLKFSFIGKDEEKGDVFLDLDIINPINNTKNDKEIYFKCSELFDKLYNIDDKLSDFEVYIQTPEDLKIPKLLEKNQELRKLIGYNINDDIWKNLLISIGNFGVSRLINGDYLDDFINVIEKNMNKEDYNNKFEYTKGYQIMIKTIYKYMNEIFGSTIENFNIFMYTIFNSCDNQEEFLIKRGYFNIKANNLIKKIKTPNFDNNKKNGLIKKFIQNNGVYFSKKQLEEKTSFHYVEQILSKYDYSK